MRVRQIGLPLLAFAVLPAVVMIGGAARETTPPQPRGYSIPTIDLAGQTHRQVVVDREKGQYLGHPTTVLLEDGKTMIAVYPKGHGRGAIVMKRSTDGGRTWSERLPTPKSWATSKEVPTLYRVVDARGKKRLIMFSGLYPIRMAVSGDNGKTWSELEAIGDFGGIVAMGSCIALKKPGRYMAMFHDDGRFFRKGGKRTATMTLFKTFSHDGGLTWSEPEAIFARSDVHLCEPGTVRSPDGKQIAALLRENRRVRNSYVIFSNDEGRTWTEPRELPASLTGDRHTLRYAPDGRLVASFRDRTHESPTKGDWVAWVGTYDDIAKGREGQYRIRLMDNHSGADCAYPGVELLPDGTFVTTTYGHWTKGESPYIASVRFKLEEIDALAGSQNSGRHNANDGGNPMTETATFGAGCFWGVEAAFRSVKGVTSTAVGYGGGTTKNPTYKEVCTDRTGHAEVVRIEFDPSRVSYEDLLNVFWDCHDPTQLNRQGPDFGKQYRTVIFFQTPEQEAAARASKERLQASDKYKGRTIVTEIQSAPEFHMAEDYHQQYLEKRGQAKCHLPDGG